VRRAVGRIDPVLLAAIVIGLCLRAWRFGELPPGLNQDEASTAYDAFSLVHFGVDRHGFRFPVVLVSWGSGMYALASYVEAPFIWLFGLRVWSARLPFLIAGVIAIPLFYRLLLDTSDRKTARLGVVFLALAPWHIMASRWSLDCNLFPFVFLAATVLLVQARERPRRLWPAAALYALALYAYGTAYVVVPVFLAVVLVHGFCRRQWSLRSVLPPGIVFLLGALPVALYVAVNSLRWPSIVTPLFSIPRLTGQPRYQTMGNLNPFSVEFFRRVVDNWLSAAQLCQRQDDGLIWNALPGFGVAYWFGPFLGLVGAALLLARNLRRPRDASFPMVAWCLAVVVLMALVSANINRANIAVFPLIYCAAVAGALLWSYRPLALLLSLLVLGCSVGFVSTYFGGYRQAAAGPFYASFGQAIEYAAEQTEGEICITDSVNMPYIFVLFYTREDPRAFAETVRYRNPGEEFEDVASFGRYRFGLKTCAESASVIVASRAEAEQFGPEGLVAKEFERYSVLLRKKPEP
jgi:hypothetical protein